MTEERGLTESQPQHTLDYFVEKRGKNKRPYIYDFHKSQVCDHPRLKIIARGGIVYRCLECNYAFHIVAAYQQPLHNEVIQSAFNIFNFAKEFGQDALAEVMRRPIGQVDGTAHKPVLPEGMAVQDVLALMDGIDVTTPDGGAQELTALLERVWAGAPQGELDGQSKVPGLHEGQDEGPPYGDSG